MKIKIFILSLVFISQLAMAEIHVNISHSIATINDYITITFTHSDQVKQVTPNFKPLEKNFIISSSSKSNQISIINGNVKRQSEWQLVVKPKKVGTLTVPAINFGLEKSLEQKITIEKSNSSAKVQSNQSIFMRASTSPSAPYVQQQIIYNVKLYYQRPPSSGEFSAPVINHAIMEPIGKSKNYTTQINGTRYKVAEQNFAVFADKSGKLTFNSPIFNGTIRRSNITNINQILNDLHQPISLSAPKVKIKIKPIPKQYSANTWLPAKSLTLEEEWQSSKAQPGEPITRIVKLKALGLMASQLPDLVFESVNGVKVYPDPSNSDNQSTDNNISGEKTFKVVYIPTGDQNITIPGITVSWWNTNTDKMETVALNEKRITFAVSSLKPKIKKEKQQVILEKEKLLPIKKEKTYTTLSFQNLLPWLLVILLSVILFLTHRNKKREIKKVVNKKVLSKHQMKNQLKKACMENDAESANHLLLEVSKKQWPQLKLIVLSDLLKVSNDLLFSEQIELLQKALYSSQTQWQGNALWKAFLNFKVDEQRPKKKDRLPRFN